MAMFGPILFLLLPMLLPNQPITPPVSPALMVRHVPNQCQFVMTADVSTLLPYLFSTANKLANHPFLQQNMKLRRRVMGGLMMAKMQRASVQQKLGVDPIKALRYVTIAAQVDKKRRNGRLVVIAGGDFSAAKIAPLMAQMMGSTSAPVQLKDGFSYIEGRAGGPVLGWYPKGPLFIGKRRHLLHFAKNGALRGGKPAADSAAARLLANHLPGSLLTAGFVPPPALKAKLLRRAPGIVKQLVGAMTYFQGALQYNGSSMLVESPDAAVRTKYLGIFRSLGLFALSGDYATRGLLQLASTLLDPTDTSLPKPLRSLAQHKDTLMPLIFKKIGRTPVKFKLWPAGDQINLQLLGNPGLGVAVLGSVVGYFSFGMAMGSSQMAVQRPATIHRYRRHRRHRRHRRYRRYPSSTTTTSPRRDKAGTNAPAQPAQRQGIAPRK